MSIRVKVRKRRRFNPSVNHAPLAPDISFRARNRTRCHHPFGLTHTPAHLPHLAPRRGQVRLDQSQTELQPSCQIQSQPSGGQEEGEENEVGSEVRIVGIQFRQLNPHALVVGDARAARPHRTGCCRSVPLVVGEQYRLIEVRQQSAGNLPKPGTHVGDVLAGAERGEPSFAQHLRGALLLIGGVHTPLPPTPELAHSLVLPVRAGLRNRPRSRTRCRPRAISLFVLVHVGVRVRVQDSRTTSAGGSKRVGSSSVPAITSASAV